MSLSRKRDARTEHQYVGERLSAYLDGELSSRDREAVDRHLAVCRHCRWNLETLRQTIRWTGALPAIPVPRAFTIPVQAERVRTPRWRWSMPVLQGATALVAVLFFLAVAGNSYFARTTPASQPPVAVSVEATKADVQEARVTVEMEKAIAVEPSSQPETSVPAPVVATAPVAIGGGEQMAESQDEISLAAPAPDAEATDIRVLEAAEEAPFAEAESQPEAETIEGEPGREAGLQKPTAVPPPAWSPTAETLSVATPAEVARADTVEAEPAGAEVGEAVSGVVQEPQFAWLAVAEIVLGVAFVLLGTVTVVLMLRRMRVS